MIINDRPQAVVGVMPPGFRFPHDAQLYALLVLEGDTARTIRTVSGIAVLKPGVTGSRRRRMRTPSRRDWNRTSRRPTAATAFALTFRDSHVTPQTRIAMGALMTAVVFVLLIACANLANLLFVRALRGNAIWPSAPPWVRPEHA